MGSHLCELDADFTACNSHDRRLWPVLNGAGSHSPVVATAHTGKCSCASFTPFQVWIQAHFWTWFAPETDNRDVSDPPLWVTATAIVNWPNSPGCMSGANYSTRPNRQVISFKGTNQLNQCIATLSDNHHHKNIMYNICVFIQLYSFINHLWKDMMSTIRYNATIITILPVAIVGIV